MQISASVGAIISSFCLAATAAPVEGSVSAARAPFTVSKFNAGATPHSSIGYIELSWSYATGANASQCTARPATYQVFPSVEQTACDNPMTSFNLTQAADGGADLELWYKQTAGRVAHGVHHIAADEIVWSNQQSPTGQVQVYAGPQNFTVDATYPEV
ncbi:hypothetical protein F5Y15DRAFT_322354 [Xylariaceae sp. FL0016]|nr:hypothetical protein F5Y15DRAFT_322354 [Xylariaceae sp. FL0016]